MEHKKMLHLKTKKEVMYSQPIQTQRGIFHGEYHSPLLFCIPLTPLTNKLNRTNCGYKEHGTERKMSHLLYMDDFKLPDRSEDNMENEINIVKAISKDTNINFG